MSVKFPNSDMPIRHADLDQLAGAIAFLSGRLVEQNRELEGVRSRLSVAYSEARNLRQERESLRAELEAVKRDQGDSGAVRPADGVKLVLKVEPPVLRNERRDGRVGRDGLEVVVNVGSDPESRLGSMFVFADDQDAVTESFVLSDDEVEIVVSLRSHADLELSDGQERQAGHSSSPSVGARDGQGVGAPEPTEGVARTDGASGVSS